MNEASYRSVRTLGRGLETMVLHCMRHRNRFGITLMVGVRFKALASALALASWTSSNCTENSGFLRSGPVRSGHGCMYEMRNDYVLSF